jgi:hypothetical protein
VFEATGEKDAILFKTVLIRPTICVCHSTIETSGARTIKLFDPSNLLGATTTQRNDTQHKGFICDTQHK